MERFEEVPALIENNVKHFLSARLQNSHHLKTTYYNGIYNMILLFLLLVIVGGVLMYKYKGKPTPEDKARKTYEQQQYILSLIRTQQLEKMRNHQELLTGLPHWDTEYSVRFWFYACESSSKSSRKLQS